jgi:hypothetical protein
MDILGGDDDPELAVDFDDIALAERTGDDFHGFLGDLTKTRGAPYRSCVQSPDISEG